MKKNIEINEEDAKFLNDYKQSHGVVPSKFIDMAIQEKIVRTKAELSAVAYNANKISAKEFLNGKF